MRQFNPRYQYAAELPVIRPQFTVSIAFDFEDTDIAYFTSHDESQAPTGVQGVFGCLETLSGSTQKIDPLNASSSIGSITFKLVDVDGQVSEIFRQKELEGKSPREKRVRIYYGHGVHEVPSTSEDAGSPVLGLVNYERLDWLDFEIQLTMIFTDYQVGPGYVVCRCDDIQRLKIEDIFVQDVSSLTQTVTAEQMRIPIAENDATTKFIPIQHDESYSDRPGELVGYVEINKEAISHAGVVNDPVFGVSLDVIERGALNTLASGHTVESGSSGKKVKVSERIVLEGPPLKLLYAILTGVLFGQGGARLPDHWHLAVPESMVRLEDFENAESDLWLPSSVSGRRLRFDGLGKVNGEVFLREEILSFLVAVQPIYSDGSIGYKRLDAILDGASYVRDIGDSEIVSISELKHQLKNVLNNITIDWDHDYQQDQFLQRLIVLTPESKIQKYGKGKPKSLAFKGVRSSDQNDQDIRNIADGYRNRFAGGGFAVSCELLPKVNDLEVGDVIRLSTQKLVDPLLGGPLSRVFEVQQITPNTRTSRQRVSLFASSDTPGQFIPIGTSAVMEDAFYSSVGTDLSTLPQVVNGVIVSDLTLNGGIRMGVGVFYHLGNLTLAEGVTLTVRANVQLRVMGRFTRFGTINGVGQGHAGGAAGTQFVNGTTLTPAISIGDPTSRGFSRALLGDIGSGIRGYMGDTQPANYFFSRGFDIAGQGFNVISGFYFEDEVIRGRNASAERLLLRNREGVFLDGIEFLDLRGTSGSGSRPLVAHRPGFFEIVQSGEPGGAGGAGLVVICRGETVGVSSLVNLSGEPGTAPVLFDIGPYELSGVREVANGGSAGGYPGAYYLIVDGNASFSSNITNVRQDIGASGIAAGTNQYVDAFDDSDGNLIDYPNFWSREYGASYPINFGRGRIGVRPAPGDAAFKVQFIPPPEGVIPIDDDPVVYTLRPIAGGITLFSGNETLLAAGDGGFRERVRVSFAASLDAQATNYEVQARNVTEGQAYVTVAVVTSPLAFFDVTEGLDYQVRVRVLSDQDDVAPSPWVESSTHTAQGKSIAPADPSRLDVIIDAALGVVLLTDQHPDPDFLQYVIESLGVPIDAGNKTRFEFGFLGVGQQVFRLFAQDRSGNLSNNFLEQSISIAAPSAPLVDVSFSGQNYVLTMTPGAGSYAVDVYEITLNGVVIAETADTVFSAVVGFQGNQNGRVRAIDVGGNASAYTDFSVIVTDPGRPVVSAQSVDNVVTLFYRSTPGSLPIRRYLLSRGPSPATAEPFEDKSGDSTFTVITEDQGGEIGYHVRAEDVAGNLSETGSVIVNVSAPPDFVLSFAFDERANSFPGVRSNAILDNDGDLILLVDDDETWQAYASNGFSNFQSEIDAGHTLWLQPGAATASYVSVHDIGAEVASSFINLIRDIVVLSGSVTYSVYIGYSSDGVSFTESEATQVFAENFRYVRLRIEASQASSFGLLSVRTLALRVQLKQENDGGSATALAADVNGTRVNFNKNFLNVVSINVTPESASPYVVSYIKDPSFPPQYFDVRIWDLSGNRQTVDFTWQAQGNLSNS